MTSSTDSSPIEAGDRPPIHAVVLAVAAVKADDEGLVTERAGIGLRSAECLCPVGGQPLRVVGLETVTEGVTDDRVNQHAGVPGFRETQNPGIPTRGLVHAAHGQDATDRPRRHEFGEPIGPPDDKATIGTIGRAGVTQWHSRGRPVRGHSSARFPCPDLVSTVAGKSFLR